MYCDRMLMIYFCVYCYSFFFVSFLFFAEFGYIFLHHIPLCIFKADDGSVFGYLKRCWLHGMNGMEMMLVMVLWLSMLFLLLLLYFLREKQVVISKLVSSFLFYFFLYFAFSLSIFNRLEQWVNFIWGIAEKKANI